MSSLQKSYVLITSAKNEEKYIERTLDTVTSQTILPKKWIIVSDGSLDRTDDIVLSYSNRHSYIELIRVRNPSKRSFASKAYCLNIAHERLNNLKFRYIGNLDADVSISLDYFEKLIATFEENEYLGIIGGVISEFHNGRWIFQRISKDSVAGATQFFRRECFEACGRYVPLELGGEDAVMENIAKMKGWGVKTIFEKVVYHHGRVDIGKLLKLKSMYRQGKMFYMLGYNPLFFLLRAVYRIIDKPFLMGSVFQISGYVSAALMKEHRRISHDVLDFIRLEQKKKIISLLMKRKREFKDVI